MIREVRLEDVKAITAIYNEYVINSTATFETQPVKEEEMCTRVRAISTNFPYFVYEADNEIAGYCYAHPWKEKAAYKYTLETTIYLSPKHTGKGIGRQLLQKLIDECRRRGFHALIACITEGNETSNILHAKLGFNQVSRFEQVGLKFDRWLGVADYELVLSPTGLSSI